MSRYSVYRAGASASGLGSGARGAACVSAWRSGRGSQGCVVLFSASPLSQTHCSHRLVFFLSSSDRRPAPQGFEVGQRAQMRDGDKAWNWGTVTSVQPLKVNQKPGGKGFTWDEVRSEAQVRQRRPPCARCLCVAPCRASLLTCATPVQANAAGDKYDGPTVRLFGCPHRRSCLPPPKRLHRASLPPP